MKHKANVDFITFRDIVTPTMVGNRCEVRLALGSALRNIPRFPIGRALILESEWEEWLHEIDLPENTKEYEWLGRDGKERNISNFVSILQARGDGSKKLAAALYYRLHYHVENLKYAESVDKKNFGKGKTFEGINSGTPVFEPCKDKLETTEIQKRLAPPQKIHLGPVTILLGSDDNPIPLSLQEANDDKFISNGIPNVFKALNWRSRLTSLHGREKQYNQLLYWARNAGNEKPKVLLVSGQGGVGKTRLVADIVDKLVETHKWAAHSLKSINSGDVLEVGGKGVALVIDYPEENTDQVKKILKAAAATVANDTADNSPARIILVSRENLDAWGEILNDPYPYWIEEIRFEASPYLDKIDALQITEDIAECYPKLISRSKPTFTGVEAWLDSHPSHRLPLITLAASVHAVLEPEEAFTLAGKDVLIALAKIERKRVRYYSERNLKNVRALEKLLGLSLLTEDGLSKETVCALGDVDICPGLSGNALLEAVQQTPFWKKKTKQRPSHLVRLEPNRPAAAFIHLALALDEPLPSMPHWMTFVAAQGGEEFGKIIGRVAMDLGYVDPEASRTIENQAIEMLDNAPDLAVMFEGLAFQKSSVFSATFSSKVCNILLSTTSDLERQASLTHNFSAKLSTLGLCDESIQYQEEALRIYSQLNDAQPEDFQRQQITALVNLAMLYSNAERNEDALECANKAGSIISEQANTQLHIYPRDLSHFLLNISVVHSKIGQYETAIENAKAGVNILRQLERENPKNHLYELSIALQNLAFTLFQLRQYEQALPYAEETVHHLNQLAEDKPEFFQPDLAKARTSLAKLLINLGRSLDALDCAEKAEEIYRRLFEMRPEIYAQEFSEILNDLNVLYCALDQPEKALKSVEKAIVVYKSEASVKPEVLSVLKCDLVATLSILGRYREGLESADEVEKILRQLSETNPEIFQPKLALLLHNCAHMFLALMRRESALKYSAEAVEKLKPFFLQYPIRYNDWMASLVDFYLSICEDQNDEPNWLLLQPIITVLNKIRC